MSEESVEADFAAAQTGRGACLVSQERARGLVSLTRSSDCCLQTMEAFEVQENGSHVPTCECGIIGLRHDERDAASPESLSDIADLILAETDKVGLTMLLSIWIADRESFRPASR